MRMLNKPLVLDVFSIFIIKVYLAVMGRIRTVMIHHHYPFGRFVVPQWYTDDKDKTGPFALKRYSEICVEQMVVLWLIEKVFYVRFAPKIEFVNAPLSKLIVENVSGLLREVARSSQNNSVREYCSDGIISSRYPQSSSVLWISPSYIESARAFPRGRTYRRHSGFRERRSRHQPRAFPLALGPNVGNLGPVGVQVFEPMWLQVFEMKRIGCLRRLGLLYHSCFLFPSILNHNCA